MTEYTLSELAGKNLKDLYTILEKAIDEKAGNDQLDLILRECFVQIGNDAIPTDPDVAHKVMEMSDYLAVDKGVATAVDHYKHHLIWSKDWKEDGDLKYSFKDEGLKKNISPELKLKIVNDIATIAGVAPNDVMDKVDGDLVGIKIKDTSVANRVVNELKSNAGSSVDMEKFADMSDDEKKQALSWWFNFKKDFVDTGWSAWQKTWDKAQKSILDQKTVEGMGEEMCLQMFLLPFKLFENYMAKLDDWAKDFAKSRNEIFFASAQPTPVPPPKEPEPPEDMPKGAVELAKFMTLYVNTVEEEAKTNPDRKGFAEELRSAFNDTIHTGITKEEFYTKHGDLHKRIFADFDHTLVKNFTKAFGKTAEEATNLDQLTVGTVVQFFKVDFFPDAMKKDLLDRLEAEGIQMDDLLAKLQKSGIEVKKEWREGKSEEDKKKKDHDDRGGDHSGDKDHRDRKKDLDPKDPSMRPSNSAPARAEARIRAIIWGKSEVNGVDPDGNTFTEDKNDALRNPYLISAKTVETKDDKGNKTGEVVHHYGTIIDEKSKTITRYHEQDGKVTSVTYFVEKGSAVIRESTVADGKVVASSAEKHVEGLTTGEPTLDGNPLPPGRTKQWQELFGRNEAFYKIGAATNFTGSFGMGHKIAQTVQDQTEQKTQWNLIQETIKSKKTR